MGLEVTLTREEWDREFFTSHVEYLSVLERGGSRDTECRDLCILSL